MSPARQTTRTHARQLFAILLIFWWGGMNCVVVCAAHLNSVADRDCAATQAKHACCVGGFDSQVPAISQHSDPLPLAVECCNTGDTAALVPRVKRLNQEFGAPFLQPSQLCSAIAAWRLALITPTRSRLPDLRHSHLSFCILLI